MNNEQPIIDRRRQTDCADHERRLISVEHAADSIKEMLQSLDSKMDKVLEKINRIDVLEEKNAAQQAEVARAHQRVAEHEQEHAKDVAHFEEKVSALARETRQFISETKGMARMAWILWGIVSSGVFIMLIKVLFFTSVKIGI